MTQYPLRRIFLATKEGHESRALLGDERERALALAEQDGWFVLEYGLVGRIVRGENDAKQEAQ